MSEIPESLPTNIKTIKLITAGSTDNIILELDNKAQTVLAVRCLTVAIGPPVYGQLFIGGMMVKRGWFGTFSANNRINISWVGSRFIPLNDVTKRVTLLVINDGTTDRLIEVTATIIEGFVPGGGGDTPDLPQFAIYEYSGSVAQVVGEPTPIGMAVTMNNYTGMKLLSYSLGPDDYAAGRTIPIKLLNQGGTRTMVVIDVVSSDNQLTFGPKQIILQHDDVASTPAHIGAIPEIYLTNTGQITFLANSLANLEVFTIHFQALLLSGRIPTITVIGAAVTLTDAHSLITAVM